jgi:uncharacterized protein YjgD (DUF1641 family)
MARPIPLELPPRDPRQELSKRLEQAPLQHAEALLDGYDLLQELHESGVLQLLRGVASASDKLIESAVDATKQEESIRAIRNAILLGKMLGSIDPEVLKSISIAVSETLGRPRQPAKEPPGMLSLIGEFRNKELRRSVALINRFLRSLGEQFKLRGSPESRH